MSGYISCTELAGHLGQIHKGDIVYVVSDVLELAKQAREHGDRFDRDAFLNSLQEKVGEEGTLLVPTFNWDFCKGIPFDYYRTPCRTGALGTAALKRDDFIRTKHPIYSFAVWGKDQKELFAQDAPNSFGKNSIFDYMYRKDAKALVIGLDAMDGLSFMHHVEQMEGVPFRFEKSFAADYTDWNHETSRKEYTMYVRDLDMDAKENTKHFSQILEDLNISRTRVLNGIPFRTVLLRPVYELEAMDIRLNDSRNLYIYKGQKDKNED